MRVNVNMISSNENVICAYLSQYSEEPKWLLSFHDKKGAYPVPVGCIVYSMLNRINRIKDDGQMGVSSVLTQIEQGMESECFDKESWQIGYNELLSIIDNRKEMNTNDKFKAYTIYRQFGYFLVRNLAWDEWLDYANGCEDIKEIESYFEEPKVIVRRGNCIQLKGSPCTCFMVDGFEYLFILDLWELLFNPNVDTRVKKCPHCNEFFYTATPQQKYCHNCKEKKTYNRIKNKKQQEDEEKALAKKIADVLYRRGKALTTENGNEYLNSEYYAFLDENQYYKDILKGKSVEPNPNYLNINTVEEYLSWLKTYHASLIRKRGRKNGKTDETGKRDGSDS